jgi:hypothetical protein
MTVCACTQCSCIACPARLTILSFSPCNSHALTFVYNVQDNFSSVQQYVGYDPPSLCLSSYLGQKPSPSLLYLSQHLPYSHCISLLCIAGQEYIYKACLFNLTGKNGQFVLVRGVKCSLWNLCVVRKKSVKEYTYKIRKKSIGAKIRETVSSHFQSQWPTDPTWNTCSVHTEHAFFPTDSFGSLQRKCSRASV